MSGKPVPPVRSSFEDLTDPKARQRETVRISKAILRKALVQAGNEIEYLIASTPTGTERNIYTEININLQIINEIMKNVL